MKQTEIEKALEQEIYSARMLVLLETDDGFVQFHFTPEHFKKVSDAVAAGYKLVSKKGTEEVLELRLGEDPLPSSLFEGMRDSYTEDED